MHETERALRMLVPAVLSAFVMGCSANPFVQGGGEFAADDWTTSRVEAAFVRDGTLKESEIKVETIGGAARLSGFVSDSEQASHAGDVAASIKGVVSVRNEIQVNDDIQVK